MRATRRNRSLRVLDRYVGIPLLSLFALAPRRRQPARETIRRIGLLKTAALGDTFLLAGVVQDLAREYPAATFVLITGEDNQGAATLLPLADPERIVVAPNAPVAAVRAVRRARLDLLIDFGSWPRFDAMLAALSGARFRLGFRTAGQQRHFAYDRTVDHSATAHELENYRRLVRALGVRTEAIPSIPLRGTLDAAHRPHRPYVVFHPWSGGFRHEVKEWPAARWVELARRLDTQVVITAGPGDLARARELERAVRVDGSSVTVGEFSLAELPHALAESDVVVTVNTGVMHLAALVGARTVSLEGPVPVERWGPVGPRTRSVMSTLPGCGYLHLGFEYAGHRSDCMDGVSVDAVLAAILELRRA